MKEITAREKSLAPRVDQAIRIIGSSAGSFPEQQLVIEPRRIIDANCTKLFVDKV